MDFTATSGGGDGGSYERPKPGRYTGIMIGFADIGTHATQYGSKRKICLRWELHKRNGPAVDSQGNVQTILRPVQPELRHQVGFRKVIERTSARSRTAIRSAAAGGRVRSAIPDPGPIDRSAGTST